MPLLAQSPACPRPPLVPWGRELSPPPRLPTEVRDAGLPLPWLPTAHSQRFPVLQWRQGPRAYIADTHLHPSRTPPRPLRTHSEQCARRFLRSGCSPALRCPFRGAGPATPAVSRTHAQPAEARGCPRPGSGAHEDVRAPEGRALWPLHPSLEGRTWPVSQGALCPAPCGWQTPCAQGMLTPSHAGVGL